jgi:hypothetical protein
MVGRPAQQVVNRHVTRTFALRLRWETTVDQFQFVVNK